ncbi:MAG: hypothetical protein E7365_01815 [Clostridiales bacterium]|nr:hypothetical protein [Clostridiales bacterium]
MQAKLVFENGNTEFRNVTIKESDGVTIASLSPEEIGSGVSYVDFLFDHLTAKVGDPGYFVTDAILNGTIITEFKPREETKVAPTTYAFIGCYGQCYGTDGILGIVTGMRYDFGSVVQYYNGTYSTYPRFYLDGDYPYEDIKVEFYHLEDGSYSSMARKYREYQLTRGGCVPLAERVKKDPRLKKSVDSIAVRVRQGWKPVPSPVENQTPETEPPMHVACTFSRVGDIAEEFRKANIPEAEFCLVGWNYGGHDGRFPQIFPPDPRLGGEEEMVKLIKKVKDLGYGIVCHDDATAAYTIADCFDEEYLLRNKDGNLHLRPTLWSGGRPHKICPQREYERFEVENQEKLAQLGFEGIHYIDVITILPLLKCYDPRHPLSRQDSAYWYRKIMKLSREKFGGFSSESSFDFAASDLDYVLYATFSEGKPAQHPFSDRVVPFFELVYHGIMLYNPCTFTLNYCAKGVDNRLKYIEYGGRPLACYYANFAQHDHWMGLEDLLCDNDEQLADSVKRVKQMADDYALFESVRYEFMDSHEKIADGVFRTVYSNGMTVTVDYNKGTFDITNK